MFNWCTLSLKFALHQLPLSNAFGFFLAPKFSQKYSEWKGKFIYSFIWINKHDHHLMQTSNMTRSTCDVWCPRVQSHLGTHTAESRQAVFVWNWLCLYKPRSRKLSWNYLLLLFFPVWFLSDSVHNCYLMLLTCATPDVAFSEWITAIIQHGGLFQTWRCWKAFSWEASCLSWRQCHKGDLQGCQFGLLNVKRLLN